ncbi:methyltransferase family protein [Ilumatobacter sp.]|uniref:methyltransferase family protein n=1 Tax=Ilumatobacter sp. TaxID=1967498 RepID=UPI003C405CA5
MTVSLTVAVWLTWAVLVVGTGYSQTESRDRIDVAATRVSQRADAVTVASMTGAAVTAIWLPSADLSGAAWFGLFVGTGVVAVGLAGRHWAARTLGSDFTRSVAAPDRLVTTGPYRFVRHPSYAGLLWSLLGLGVTLWNWASFAIMAIGCSAAQVVRIHAEEKVLEARMGVKYRDFERTRKRLVPGIW